MKLSRMQILLAASVRCNSPPLSFAPETMKILFKYRSQYTELSVMLSQPVFKQLAETMSLMMKAFHSTRMGRIDWRRRTDTDFKC